MDHRTIKEQDIAEEARCIYNPEADTINFDIAHPWRVALIIASIRVQFIVDLSHVVLIGRSSDNHEFAPSIDLAPFSAKELGVSRMHVLLTIENSRVVVVDNYSSNSTRLNGKRLIPERAYPVHNGDKLVLGRLAMEIGVISKPVTYSLPTH